MQIKTTLSISIKWKQHLLQQIEVSITNNNMLQQQKTKKQYKWHLQQV